jgi:putative membrane protein
MWGHMGEYGWDWGSMGLAMLLLWGLLIAVFVILAKGSWSIVAGEKREREKSALDILKERYARGEIERDEFEQKKNDLSK